MAPDVHQPKGQILLFGPSFSGKSYLTNAFKKMGLKVYDLEKEGQYIYWVNDETRKSVANPPKKKSSKWLSENHFLMDRQKVKEFLKEKSSCIVFAHSWDILECLDLFSKSYFMYVPPEELEKRMEMARSDHNQESKSQLDFMHKRHKDRLDEVKRLGIPIIDVSQSPEIVLKSILSNTS